MRNVRASVGLLLALAIPGLPAAYASHRLSTWRHFRVVEEGKLYRSGQLAPDVLDRLIHDHGIRTVVCLRALARDAADPPEDAEELKASGVAAVFTPGAPTSEIVDFLRSKVSV